MRILYHFPLHPQSRKIRIILREKQLEAKLQSESYWERRSEFLALNPAGEIPILIEDSSTILTGNYAITEYCEEAYPAFSLLSADSKERAEVRRLLEWFDNKFQRDVTQNLLHEKFLRRMMGLGQPNSAAIRAGKENIHMHLEYIAWLTERRSWLAGNHFSLADIAAAAQLSCIDYLGDVPWEQHEEAKGWYARVKSRPSFRAILADHVPGIQPPAHYTNLDF